jgi:hypothetical protein
MRRRRAYGWIFTSIVSAALGSVAWATPALAIDYYEIQIYGTDTAPLHQLVLELHSNTVSTATGSEAKAVMNPYQIHETLEATYGVLSYLEVGQYLCTAKLSNGNYEYAGSRTKMHFGVPQTDTWPMQLGGNIELDYMRRAAEDNPFTLELRPIVESSFRGFTLIGNFPFDDPFSGPGAHKGWQFSPSGEILYQLTNWVAPAVEYYGDMGSLEDMRGAQHQQHFLFPTLNFDVIPQLELNLGVGFGLTRASNGVILKSIVGWTF